MIEFVQLEFKTKSMASLYMEIIALYKAIFYNKVKLTAKQAKRLVQRTSKKIIKVSESDNFVVIR